MDYFIGCANSARAVAALNAMVALYAHFHIALTSSDHNLLQLNEKATWLGKRNDTVMLHSSKISSVC